MDDRCWMMDDGLRIRIIDRIVMRNMMRIMMRIMIRNTRQSDILLGHPQKGGLYKRVCAFVSQLFVCPLSIHPSSVCRLSVICPPLSVDHPNHLDHLNNLDQLDNLDHLDQSIARPFFLFKIESVLRICFGYFCFRE